MRSHAFAARIVGSFAIVSNALPLNDARALQNTPQQNINALINLIEAGKLLGQAAYDAVADELADIVPTATPTTSAEVVSELRAIWTATPTDFTDIIKADEQLIQAGFDPSILTSSLDSEDNNTNNVNPREPYDGIYPKKQAKDAPYSRPEGQLRSWIHIPKSFTYGTKPPVIFIPGTGELGYGSFAPNIAKLIGGKPYVDPVFLNPSGHMLDDAQVNAEMVAYAINYISGISKNRNVSLISWSQGGPSSQWALKYWPSTRAIVSDFIALSPDFHGTVVAPFFCFPGNACPPSLIQQENTAKFISTLLSNGGDSAYVPTTEIHSAFFDEIVEPQQGTGASAYLKDARGVGVLNAEIQQICAGKGQGDGFVLHESVLEHPLSIALIEDALTHEGTANLDRINLTNACNSLFAKGLGIDDVIATEILIPYAVAQIEEYPSKTRTEPSIMPYAA